MNKKIIGKRVISFIMVMAMCFTNMTLYGIDANAEEKVTVAVKSQPYANVLLTVNETNLDLTTFERDVRAGLENKGIDTTNIEFQAIEQKQSSMESTDLNFAQVVNSWTTIGAPTWTATSDGQIYSKVGPSMYGDYSHNNPTIRWSAAYNANQNGWWGTGLLNPNGYETDNIEMDFTLVQGGTLNEGVCFFVTRNNDGSLNGYFFNVTEHVGGTNGLYQLRLWKMTNYQLDQSFTAGLNSRIWCWDATHDPQAHSSNQGGSPWVVGSSAVGGYGSYNSNIYDYGTSYCMAGWTLNWAGNENLRRNVKYHVSAKDGHIVITMNGTKVVDIYDNTYTKGTYGFWGNNCEQVASMYLKDFNIQTIQTITRTYTQLTQDAGKIFQEGETNIIVDVDNSVDNSLSDPAVATWTNANGVQFLAWGNATNKSHLQNFITKSNDGRGTWIDGSNYNNALNATVNYIANLLDDGVSNEDQYVIVGQDSTITVTPPSYKTGAVNSNGVGRWHITHNYSYYANDLGLSTQTEKDVADLICNFDKPGEYIIQFDGEEIKRVYAHRLPTADFSIGINGTSLTLTSQSQDLDSNTNNGYGKGIKAEHWYYKTLDAASWTSGKLTTFDRTKIYLIKLEVEDFQGATAYTTKYVGTGNPVANFNLNSYNFSNYQTIGVNDTSYDPEGYTISAWNWTLSKNGNQIATSTAQKPTFDFKTLGTGEYKLTLMVTNSKGIKSSSYSRDFTVIDDTDAPEMVSLSPTNCDWKTGTHTINFSLKDVDSGLKNWYYAITTSATRPTSWSAAQTGANGSVTTPSTTGEYYLHILAYDNANNELYRNFSAYKIDNTNPVINKLTIANDCTKVVVDASDAGSGIAGYAITTTNTAPNTSAYQASNELKIYKSGTYYVWVKDKVGQVSAAKSVVVNRKQTATINYVDNNDSEKLRPSKVTLSIYRNGTFLKDVELDGTTTSYTFENLDSMDSTGKAYTYTFGLDVNERYAIKVDGDTITATMKQTTFSVIIPKTISLNGETGSATYNVETSGNLYLNDTVSVTPDASFTMKDSTKYQTMNVSVSQPAKSFKKNNLGTSKGTLTTSRKEFAGKWNGTFNFAIKLTKAN